MSQGQDARVGTTVGGYRIDSQIGRGGMSVVYLAEHLRLKRKAALKLIAPELAGDQKFRDRFLRESELAASLDHPNIIPIYDAGEVDGLLYIAMRYVEGTDLKGLIQSEGLLEPNRTVTIVSQIGRALDAAHGRGLVHRDVKAGNILLTPEEGGEDHVYLSDFGLTKRTTSDSGITATGQFVGTLDYAAPEQFEGKPLDGRADIYSLGCVLYECLTGEVPFKGDNEAALVYAHLLKPPPRATALRPELPVAVDDIVAKAMAKSPDERYSTAAEMVRAARTSLGVEATTTVTEAPPAPLTPRRKSQATLAGVATLVVVALVLGLVVFRLSGAKAPPARSASNPVLGDRLERITQVRSDATFAQITNVKVGRDPSAVAVGEGSIWVANEGDNTILRIDPVTNGAKVIKVGSRPDAISIGEGAVWVVNRVSRTVSRINPGTDQVDATIALNGVGAPTSIAAGGGAVWVGINTDYPFGEHPPLLDRIDPQVNQDVASITMTGLTWTVVAIGDGVVWAATGSGDLFKIDPGTNRAKKVRNLGIEPGAIVVAEGDVWVAANLSGGVTRIDPKSGKIVATIPGGGSSSEYDLLGLSGGDGIIWVTDSADGTVSRIVAGSNTPLQALKVEGFPTGLADGYGALWVTVTKSPLCSGVCGS